VPGAPQGAAPTVTGTAGAATQEGMRSARSKLRDALSATSMRTSEPYGNSVRTVRVPPKKASVEGA